jgi:hypothetical protein
MIVKPSISFINSDSDAQLVTDTQVILQALADNLAIYASPSPTVIVVKAGLDKFINAIAAAADGGIALTAAKNAARAELGTLLRNLASYVGVACKGNMENLLLSGFPVQKPNRTAIGVLPPPMILSLNLGARSGELEAKATALTGAAIYNWRLMATGQTVPSQTAQTTAATTVFEGLTPGLVYSVECNVVGAAGPSDWSQPVSQMVV